MNSPKPNKSPKGNIDTPIVPLLDTINSHPSYFTTSSCSGRISIFSQPTTPSASSKKKAKEGTWLFISYDNPINPNFVTFVFRFEPLIIAVECRGIEAAQFLVSLAISCGFMESRITSVSKRIIIAIRCSIRLEVPLGDSEKIMVSAGYVKYLVKLANEKMKANKKITDNFLDALLKNGFSRYVQSVKKVIVNYGVDTNEESGCVSDEKLESLPKSSNNHGSSDRDRERRGLDHS